MCIFFFTVLSEIQIVFCFCLITLNRLDCICVLCESDQFSLCQESFLGHFFELSLHFKVNPLLLQLQSILEKKNHSIYWGNIIGTEVSIISSFQKQTQKKSTKVFFMPLHFEKMWNENNIAASVAHTKTTYIVT